MKLFFVVGVLAIAAGGAMALRPPGVPPGFNINRVLSPSNNNNNNNNNNKYNNKGLIGDGFTDTGIPPYAEMWFDQAIDHFNFQTGNVTFKQRYLVSGKFYSEGGPMLFYTGNEGDITDFWQNTGFMFVLAEKLGAYVAFAEHRYFGKSMPFGPKDSFLPSNVGYLTVEQALRDYAVIVPHIKSLAGMDPDDPVVCLGGSYGGMLSGWFRMQYPSIVAGALAASAPLLWYQGTVDPEAFNEIATNDFKRSGDTCANTLRVAIRKVQELSQTASGRQQLSSTFGTCSLMKPGEEATLISTIYNGLTYMAMTDYPSASNFLQPMPAWPVSVACEKVAHADEPVAALAGALGVYYNFTGQTACYNLTGSGTSSSGWLGNAGWDYLACTSQVMPMASNGVQDMFLPQAWDLNAYMKTCENGPWKVTPNPAWANQTFGPGFTAVAAATNIIASQGSLDPWSAGGINADTAPQNPSVVPILIEDGAHHLDLRMPTPSDPQSVIDARNRELALITQYIDEHNAKRRVKKNPRGSWSKTKVVSRKQ